MMIRKYCHCCPGFRIPVPEALGVDPSFLRTGPYSLRRKIPQIPFSILDCANRADRHSALERARGPMSPTHRSDGGMARLAIPGKGSDGGGYQFLPLSFERSIIASVSAGQQVRWKEILCG